MAASTNDKFKKVGASTVTSLAAPGKALGATSITVGSTTNFPTDTGIVIAIRVVDTAGKLVAGTYTTWSATVTSGTSFAIDPTPLTGSDQVYSAGSTTQVYMPVSSAEHNAMVDGILAQHNQDGTHNSAAVNTIGSALYPVGSIYINAINNTNPGTLLGFGTWAAFGAGRVPVGYDSAQTEFDAAEKTGGAKTHTLTTAEIPAHSHNIQARDTDDGGTTGAVRGTSAGVNFPSESEGGGGAHNNLQPFITVFMWKRTA